jgi:type IV pilus assembly protein PilA
LVEIMVVVVIIGLLAAASLPAYRLITLRSRAAGVVNDLRTFSTVFIAYSIQNGKYPDDGTLGVVPTQVAGQLPSNFVLRTSIGGRYKWNSDSSIGGLAAKASIAIQSDPANPILDDVDQLEAVDKQIDDGDLATGNLQLVAGNSLVFIIEK